MPIELSKEFFDTAGWGDINKAVIESQSGKDEQRALILQAEYIQSPDKSLLGDIKKQSNHIGDFKGMPAFNGLDINLKNVNYDQVLEHISNPINIEAIKTKEGFSNQEPTKEEIEQAKKTAFGGVDLRKKYPNSKIAQGIEHGGYVENILNDNPNLVPILAPLGAVAIPLYQLGKTTETGRELLKTSSEPASKPSIEQMMGGYEGLGRGLSKYMAKEFADFMGIEITK